jgi:hypothetical protein
MIAKLPGSYRPLSSEIVMMCDRINEGRHYFVMISVEIRTWKNCPKSPPFPIYGIPEIGVPQNFFNFEHKEISAFHTFHLDIDCSCEIKHYNNRKQ